MKVIVKQESKSVRGRGKTLVWGIHDFPAKEMKDCKILIALSAEGICWLGINCGVEKLRENWRSAELVEDATVTAKAAQEIVRLWPEHLDKLSVPVVLCGTAFQLKVWKELLKIKSGATVTYEYVARKIGKPTAVRAVGSAVGKNTVSILVPCHRVVNKSSAKINYGWGAAVKKALLRRESDPSSPRRQG